MAAEVLAQAGAAVTVFDHMPSPARKLLMAGRGGLNLTHAEPLEALLARYGAAGTALAPAIRAFPPEALRAWADGLGAETFVGSSGRVFPRALKASPLLRAWLARLAALGVRISPRHRWQGFGSDGALLVNGEALRPAATILALGGASWPRLGSDGTWPALLPGCAMSPLRPANMGFTVAWSPQMTAQAGQPLKRIAARFGATTLGGEAMLTATGIEGGVIYALSATLREAIAANGPQTLWLDLRPDLDAAALAQKLGASAASVSTRLRKAGLAPPAVALVQEALHAGAARGDLAALVKAVPVMLLAPQSLARAISTAGGLAWSELDDHYMLRHHPGVFACGEMLDWEAPTGGYLLQACFATAAAAARGALAYLAARGDQSAPPPSGL
jgi:uncharacterized flavoprotein (TIGR03862 family)